MAKTVADFIKYIKENNVPDDAEMYIDYIFYSCDEVIDIEYDKDENRVNITAVD